MTSSFVDDNGKDGAKGGSPFAPIVVRVKTEFELLRDHRSKKGKLVETMDEIVAQRPTEVDSRTPEEEVRAHVTSSAFD